MRQTRGKDGKQARSLKRAVRALAAGAILGVANISCAGDCTIRAGAQWIPFAFSPDVVPGSALDASAFSGLDAPAGRHGWVKADGAGHFVFADKPGVPQRFYGGNLCMEACFPGTEAEADRLVARLVAAGYNSIRIHHHDRFLYGQDAQRRPVLIDWRVAQFDRLMAKAIAAGLYVTTDLYVSRPVTWREIGEDRDGKEGLDFKALLAVSHEGAFENWKQAARVFFEHRNPYTGRRYVDEPALAFVCLVNESSIPQALDGLRENAAVKAAWKKWLEKRRAREPGCWPSLTPDALPEKCGGHTSEPVLKGDAWNALATFWSELEARQYLRMRAFLRDELGVKALLTDQNWGTQTLQMQAMRARLFDYVDLHGYVDHPIFPGGGWGLPSLLANRNDLLRPGFGLSAPWGRVLDKPFVMSEWNFAGPSRYRTMGGLFMGALAAVQDWSALWRFTFAHWHSAYATKGDSPGYFDIVNDPTMLFTERLASALFLRGDLDSATDVLALTIPEDAIARRTDTMTRIVLPRWIGDVWRRRVGNCLPGRAPKGARVYGYEVATNAVAPDAGVGESRAAIDASRGTMTVATPRTCAVFTTGGRLEAGPLAVASTDVPACVWASSLDGEPLEKSRRILVAHVCDVQGEGIVYADTSRRKVLKWGTNRMLMEAGLAAISLARTGESLTVWALDTTGRRQRRMSASESNGALRFISDVAANPDSATFLYELAAE